MAETIVLYPSPGMGHLIPLVQLGKLIATHYPSFTITIIISTSPFDTIFSTTTTPYIEAVSAANPSITFHHFPTITLPPNLASCAPSEIFFNVPLLNNPNLFKLLQTISPKALVIDFFCLAACSVAGDVPVYCYYTSGAACLSSLLYLPTIHRTTTKSLKDLDIVLNMPGFPPIPSSDMPKNISDRGGKLYEHFLNIATQMPKFKGIIVNTYKSLEPRAVRALSQGESVTDGPTPPIYYTGPQVATIHQRGGEHEHECLNWLNSQPIQSVLFLCFGSMGVFSGKQLKEMAIGLETSGIRFLWVVRNPPAADNQTQQDITPSQDRKLEEILPEGFLDRTRERGLVVKKWAPQLAVLSHNSVGGFVTHCGWNSILESISCGVPMLAWPLYSEQTMNRAMLVKELKLGLELEMEDGFVSATELARRASELMESERGKELRDRVITMRDAGVAAMAEGGSSLDDLDKFIQSWRQS